MLIGVDASRAARPVRTGTEGYSLELISALLRRSGPNRYRLYFDQPPFPDFPFAERAEHRVIRFPRAWTHVRLAAELIRRRPDLLFVPAHVIPLACPVPAVATIHDVGYLWHRSAYTRLAWILLHLGTLQNARAARRIIADSRATARDLVKHFGVAPGKIRVAYLGGPPVREVCPDPEVVARYRLPPRYFLFVGTLQPRKNLRRLLDAFAELAKHSRASAQLVLAGRPGVGAADLRRHAAALGLVDRVTWLSYVPEEHLPTLYRGAVALVFPSLYEGFGRPVLEAMAWGTPVIAANTSSLPEVVGTAGLLANPYDVNDLARAMARLLDDTSLRERLIAAGYQRAAGFSWDRCAAEVEAAFAEAAVGTDVADQPGWLRCQASGGVMAQPAVRTINVTLEDHGIEPRIVRVPANYPIRFVVHNAGACSHQYAAPAIPGFSIDVLPGQTTTETFTFVNVGRFEVVSNDDDDQQHGLRGELIVEALY